MKKTLISAAALCAVALFGALAGCGTGTPTPGGAGGGNTNTGALIEVTSDITADTRWASGNTYLLKKHVYVGDGNTQGPLVTLTIEPGVTVKGSEGTSLVITRSGRLEAAGTAASPIVMTSAKTEGDRDRGDWGGVVLLGRAPVNLVANADGGTATGEGYIEGFPASGSKTIFGGADPTWSCGTLRYLRVEFAGYRLAPNNELNSITLGACGSSTVVDYVQVHCGLDDGIELFGGTANLTHAVISRMEDDMLDWDNGWQGKGQFIIGFQEPAHGASGIEADNDAAGSNNLPRSSPELWNLTLIGRPLLPAATEDGNNNRGLHLRRNTGAKISNAIITNFGGLAINVESSGTAGSFTSGEAYVRNSIFWHNPTQGLTNDIVTLADGNTANADLRPDGGTFDNNFDELASFTATTTGNRVVDPGLIVPVNQAAPVLAPTEGSAALSGGATPPAGLDTSATFVGAIGPTDWTAGWTEFPAN